MTRESTPHLDDGYKRSRYRGPQTDEKKYRRNGSDDWRKLKRLIKGGAPMMNQDSGGKQPQQQQTSAGPAVSKRRE
jgi:hypothetical protein